MSKFLNGVLACSLALSVWASPVSAQTITQFPIETQTLSTPASDFTFENGTITAYNGNATTVTIPAYINGQAVTTIGRKVLDSIVDNTVTNVIISSGITTINGYAFQDARALESITIPDTVTSFGTGIFLDAYNLKSVTLPNNLTFLPAMMFQGCRSLESIKLPTKLTEIRDDAFNSCTSLKSITLPDSLHTLGFSAFINCSSLESLIIPDSVTELPFQMVTHCTNLKEIYIPKYVEFVNFSAFSSCPNLTTVYYGGSAQDKSKLDLLVYSDKYGPDAHNEALVNANWVFNASPSQLSSNQSTWGKVASPSTAKVMVNGTPVNFGAYEIDGFNYFKLTDMSYALTNTPRQFLVSWDAVNSAINMATGFPHNYLGTELQGNSGKQETAVEFVSPVYKNGEKMNVTVYTIDGSSYFQLDSLKGILGLTVGWDGNTSTITITT